MPDLKPRETGAMFWAGRERVDELASLGLRCGQLGVAEGVDLSAASAAKWKAMLADAGFTLVTVFAAYDGEDYADIPTVRRTVGFIPRATRAARERRTVEVSDFAAALGVGSIACHVGCVPDDAAHPDYVAVRDMVRRICDHAARYGQTFALETGQERAEILLEFMRQVDRGNLGINFDPANMVLYGTGDPIEALEAVAPLVRSVHCKDADWPPAGSPDALGQERPLGQGAVGIDQFVRALARLGFTGPLNIEREGVTHEEWLRDVAGGISLLKSL
jgi:sugar phosphate isomerase/epimerase